MKVNIHVAKTHLSRLIEQAASGEVVIISKAGKPVAKLVAVDADKSPRKPGLLKGKVKIAKNFDSALPKVLLDEFES